MEAKKGDLVKVHYKGSINGEVFDSSEGKQPLMFKLGDGNVIKGFDDAVTGMNKGDKKTINIPAEEAYGKRDEHLVSEIPKEQLGNLKDQVDVKPGVSFQLRDQMGNVAIATVKEVKDDSIVLDLNHPLAGKDLTFDLELVEILSPKEAEEFEKQHGCCGDGSCGDDCGCDDECDCEDDSCDDDSCGCGHEH